MTTQPLTSQTPAEIDAQLADLYGQYQAADEKLEAALGSLHYKIGERPVRVVRSTGRKTWPTTDREAEEKARALAAAGTLKPWEQAPMEATLAKVDEYRAAATAALAATEPLQAEYTRRGGWTRFHPVPGGHIHSGRGCHTLRITTDVRWMPEMSGQDEATALANLGTAGHILCTVCFPSAPVQWTVKPADPNTCKGSGKAAVANSQSRRGMNVYATCTGCDTRQILTSYSGIRKHKAPKAA